MKAQDYKKDFMDAEYFFMGEEFSKALPIYLSILEKDPDNSHINYRAGLCFMYSINPKDKETALPYLIKAVKEINPKFKEGNYKERKSPIDSYFYLGNTFRALHQFKKAVEAYENFLGLLDVKNVFYIDYVKREIESTKNAEELLAFPVKLQVENLGDKINSSNSVENCPVISFDENMLVFTSGKKNVFSPDIDLALVNQDYVMDQIYYSEKKEGRWTDPRNITKELGATNRTVPVTINKEGTELYLVQDDNDNGNIYISHYENNRWTPMRPLNKNINTKSWESHATLTVDGNTLYFTSDRTGGYGGLDIYVSNRDEKGEWGEPMNLGPTINSKWDEETPFILGDNKTLYFSSQGHYGMGGLDIFHSVKLAENTWSSPLNLGYPINTVGNDLFYIPKTNGEYAFFPLNNNERGIGKNDIFKISVSIPEGHVPEIYLKGTIATQDQKSELPKDFVVNLIDSIKGDTLSSTNPNLNTGEYVTLIKNGNFKIEYKCSGYKTHYERLFIPEIYTRTEIVVNVEMIPLEVTKGEYFVIRNIFFDYGKSFLRRESMVELERLANIMKQNPSMYIEVIGYTDAKGSTQLNEKLSIQRSKSAIDYLDSLGVDRSRFVAKGIAKSNYIAINENPDGTDNPEGRQLNRRVEIKILNSDIANVVVEEIKVPEQLKYSFDGRRRSNDTYTLLAYKGLTQLSSDKASGFTETKVGNEYIYTQGSYAQKSEAIKDLNALIDKGFNDASIISMSELGDTKNTIEQNFKNENQQIVVETGATYSIQLKALIKPTSLSVFKELKGVIENYSTDGFYRYTYGKFNTPEEAKEELKKVNEMGFPDAFVVNLKKFQSKIETVGEFTIQIKSASKPITINSFTGLKGVQERIANDGQFKYIIGKYTTIDEARKELKKIQKAGYSDAFVIGMDKFK